MFKSACGLLASALLAAAMAAPASAQEVRNLDKESSTARSFTGYLGAQPVLFEVSLPAGTSLKVDAVSTSSIDPFLTIRDARSGELLGEDDDSGGSLDAQVTVRPHSAARKLTIEVKQFSFGEVETGAADTGAGGGTFELRLANFTPQPAEAVTWGQMVQGTVNQGEERNFSITGERGMVLDVSLIADEGSEFDPYLRLLNDAGEEVAQNDDGGGALNSRLQYLMPDDGPLTIVASGYGEGAGSFTLRVAERREPLVQAPLQVIGIADIATGRLGAGYEAGGVDPDSIDYQLSDAALAAIAGGMHEITITMSSGGEESAPGTGFDPYLELGFDTPLGFAMVDSDDDGAGDLNAMIPLDLSAVAADPALLARLRIRASGLGSRTGDYTLTITEGMEERLVTAEAAVEVAE